MADLSYTIFYSWRSDLPNGTTRGLIESSIEAAAKSLKNTATVLADRDTQGVTGSPDIVQTIFSKIDECDVFVADVTSVATYHPVDKDGNPIERLKATPNANVMIELGYATQVVGWDNIICIMNDDYNQGGEIPFDIEHDFYKYQYKYLLNQQTLFMLRSQLFGNSEQFKLRENERLQEISFTITPI